MVGHQIDEIGESTFSILNPRRLHRRSILLRFEVPCIVCVRSPPGLVAADWTIGSATVCSEGGRERRAHARLVSIGSSIGGVEMIDEWNVLGVSSEAEPAHGGVVSD